MEASDQVRTQTYPQVSMRNKPACLLSLIAETGDKNQPEVQKTDVLFARTTVRILRMNHLSSYS